MIVLISIFDTIVNLYKPRIPGQLYQICIKITIFNISRRDKNKERAKSQRLSSFFELPWKDSNPHRRNQNPTCYHYTTRQFLFCEGKVREFYCIYQILRPIFFIKLSTFSSAMLHVKWSRLFM